MSILNSFSMLLDLLEQGSHTDQAARQIASMVQGALLDSEQRGELEEAMRKMADGKPDGHTALTMVGLL